MAIRAKTDSALTCTGCGYRALQWRGRCPECGAWDSFSERGAAEPPMVALAAVDFESRPRLLTGVGELDRVLGGGLVPGSAVLLAGEPGVGKSTLSLQAAAGLEAAGREVVLVCGEESPEQVALRASRVAGPREARVCTATELPSVLAAIERADVAIVDSIQTMRDPEAAGEAGSPAQVRLCAAALARAAKSGGATILLVGHVTKDGSVAGPKVLEHVVDAVLLFEGERGYALRTVRAVKNRFGSTPEVGVFEMDESGLSEVSDPSGLFLEAPSIKVPGSAPGCLLEGRRALAVEVQTLVAPAASSPARLAVGLDPSRLAVMAAVVERRGGVSLHKHDVYARIAGGLKTADPGLDLALAMALVGGRLDRAFPDSTIAIAEVGLGGELRAVPGMAVRLKEAARLGFRRAIVPESTVDGPRITIERFADLTGALETLG